MNRAESLRRLPLRWAEDCAFDVPIKPRPVLSWLCCLQKSTPHGRLVDVVGRPIWETGEQQTNRGVRVHRNTGPFWNNIPGKGEGI